MLSEKVTGDICLYCFFLRIWSCSNAEHNLSQLHYTQALGQRKLQMANQGCPLLVWTSHCNEFKYLALKIKTYNLILEMDDKSHEINAQSGHVATVGP